MKRLTAAAVLLITLMLISSCKGERVGKLTAHSNSYSGARAKYIFLFIGDGFSLAQKMATERYMSDAAGVSDGLSFSRFPAHGITTTFEASNFITDSAAAATAIASGVKTNKGVLGKSPDGAELDTLVDLAQKRGMKTGLVSSVSLDHATPAAFYAHNKSRNNYYEIARALASSNIDYLAGGLLKGRSESKAAGKADLLQELSKNGYKITRGLAELHALEAGQKAYATGELHDGEMALPFEIDRVKKEPSLSEFVRKGIELLYNSKGFFMMVESGKIDWACHRNDAATVVREVMALDEAVKAAFEFYRKHPHDTLIIVTADHECGGMSLGFSGTKNRAEYALLSHQKRSASLIDAQLDVALYEDEASFEEIKSIVLREFGLSRIELSEYELGQLEAAYEFARIDKEERKALYKDMMGAAYLHYGHSSYNPVGVVASRILNNRAGIGWTSFYHTAMPVVTYAIGAGSELFIGEYDNTDLNKKIVAAASLK